MPADTTPLAPGRHRLMDLVRGAGLGHPTHAMIVHFAIALPVAAVVFDLITRLHASSALTYASDYLLIGTLAAFVLAIVTGLADRAVLLRGSQRRRQATRHMLVQLTAALLFVADGVLRSDHNPARAHWLWIAAGLAGVAILAVGNWLGGVLVYTLGTRVRAAGLSDQGATAPDDLSRGSTLRGRGCPPQGAGR